ncbi:hypothetical protein V6Z05_00335 [Leptospira venezuelensis]|uniref:hypothetical protein n=1 Tax=Leptospira venezuelensis TaxID=1958811 RepID=UPI0012FF9512|nr:hypothetical protein [Leptospira venezuelensis]
MIINPMKKIKEYFSLICLLLVLSNCNFISITEKPVALRNEENKYKSINLQNINITVSYPQIEKIITEAQKEILKKKYTSIGNEIKSNLQWEFLESKNSSMKVQIDLSYESHGKFLLGMKDIELYELNGSKIEILNTLTLGVLPSWTTLNLCATVTIEKSSEKICGRKLQVFHTPRAIYMLSFFILVPLDMLFAVTVIPYEKEKPLSMRLLYYDSDFPGWIGPDSNPQNDLSIPHENLLNEISLEIAKSIKRLQVESRLN